MDRLLPARMQYAICPITGIGHIEHTQKTVTNHMTGTTVSTGNKFCCLKAQVLLMFICIVKPSSSVHTQNTSTLKMEILCCSGVLSAKWCRMEPQHFTSENNGSARNFHYNIKKL
jgi:hypothetical protein